MGTSCTAKAFLYLIILFWHATTMSACWWKTESQELGPNIEGPFYLWTVDEVSTIYFNQPLANLNCERKRFQPNKHWVRWKLYNVWADDAVVLCLLCTVWLYNHLWGKDSIHLPAHLVSGENVSGLVGLIEGSTPKLWPQLISIIQICPIMQMRC